MMANQLLETYFKKEEIPQVEAKIEQDKSFRETFDKIRKKQIDIFLDKLEARIDKTQDSFEERFEAFKKAVLEAEKKQVWNSDNGEKVEQQIKKEVEEKGVSWNKIVDTFKKKGFWAAVGVFFSGIFESITGFFKGIKDKLSNIKEEIKKTFTGVKETVTGESEGKWEGNKYVSAEGKLELEKQDNGAVKEIKINGEKYLIESESNEAPWIENKDGKYFFKIGDNLISVNHLGKLVDEQKPGQNEYIFSISKDTSNDGPVWKIFEMAKETAFGADNFKLVKEKYYGEIKENYIESGKTKIKFKESIQGKSFPIQDLQIEEIEIFGKKYVIEPENQKFILKKDGNRYLLAVDLISESIDFDDFSIDIREIKNQINDKNKKENSQNEYYLFSPLIKTKYTKNISRPDIFLLKQKS